MTGIERRGRLAGLCFAILLVLIAAAHAYSTPARTGWVTDEAGLLDSATANSLATRLAELQQATGVEVVVVTLKSLQGTSIETWGNALGESWKVGRSGGKDNGVLLIVAPNDRKVRIAVGYGVGNRIPDAVSAAIIADHVLPYFRSGDFPRGITAGVNGIGSQLRGVTASDVEKGTYAVRPTSFWSWLGDALTPGSHTLVIACWVLAGICIAIWLVRNVSTGRWRGSGSGWNTYGGSGSSSFWDWSDSFTGGGSSGSSGGGFSGGSTGSW
jgi:uncharacterized protein